jgi:transcription elongation factor GreA
LAPANPADIIWLMTMAARAGIRYAPRRPERRPGPAARALITVEGQQALSEELARLRQELEIEFPERLREALSFGEAHGNDDYLQIKEEEAVVASRVRQLEILLASTEVVERSESDGRVSVGSTIQIEDLASGRTSEHVLTGSHEWVAPTDISANSPIGQAILGREAGEDVTVQLPNGRSLVLKVRNVR